MSIQSVLLPVLVEVALVPLVSPTRTHKARTTWILVFGGVLPDGAVA